MPVSHPTKTALFIDGVAVYGAAKALGFDIDFKKLLAHYRATHDLLRAYYYTPLAEDQEFSSMRPLIDWLDYNGYAVVTKPQKEFTDSLGRRKVKGNLDVELAVDALEIAPQIAQAILFTGDGDFRRLVEGLQRQGVQVTVVSTIRTQPPIASDDLRRQADVFVDLETLRDVLARDMSERAGRPRPAQRQD